MKKKFQDNYVSMKDPTFYFSKHIWQERSECRIYRHHRDPSSSLMRNRSTAAHSETVPGRSEKPVEQKSSRSASRSAWRSWGNGIKAKFCHLQNKNDAGANQPRRNCIAPEAQEQRQKLSKILEAGEKVGGLTRGLVTCVGPQSVKGGNCKLMEE